MLATSSYSVRTLLELTNALPLGTRSGRPIGYPCAVFVTPISSAIICSDAAEEAIVDERGRRACPTLSRA
jgi:hypothetical protein